jgi:hypothetical protein
MKRCILFIVAAVVLLLCDASPGWAGEKLTPKWTRNGLTFERICKHGKLIVGGPTTQCLIDLTNGEIIYQTNLDSNEFGVYTNYIGTKFYVPVNNKGIYYLKEYDTKTKQFIRTIKNPYLPMSPTDEAAAYYSNSKSLKFYNAFTKELLDSIYYPISYEISRQDREFTIDNKYFLINIADKNSDYSYFYLYDRTKKEFLFQNKQGFVYCLFNKSNKIAYAENMKLAGDDTIYSYIRIYDPDQRKVVQDIKIDKYQITYLNIKMEDDIILYETNDTTYNFEHDTYNSNFSHLYNLTSNKISSYSLELNPVIYLDDNFIVSKGFYGYNFDWTTGINDITSKEDTILYPNPADNAITVKIPELYFSGSWQITDLTGKIIKKGIILPQNQLQIDISSLLPHTYYLTLRKDNLLKTYQIVKI